MRSRSRSDAGYAGAVFAVSQSEVSVYSLGVSGAATSFQAAEGLGNVACGLGLSTGRLGSMRTV